ncbi:hypothetical protein COT27_01125 [Candidatus Kuenenbacteria bacterium CG08_land_8_20_14_0_20_37_23]|uniref:General secretion pathway GspH domain-containing protein n=1 Tax=Candidatus Kuenenbacteria bacterium CG08_land_8_20_14_0_20_37_23 TaxID=1974617 RepID=A0A2M6XT50_9BACT|nr:MAG: hypothetical protein COT27_01125 [Candidatus Kuenenbacteria bacterium CG08_land_8_20_14_0_20_37_23]
MFIKSRNNQRGFTVIELIICSVIIATLTIFAAANFRGYTQKTTITKEAERLSSIFRQAHINTLTGHLVNGTRPAGFGVKLEECATDCSYILFADEDGDYLYESETDIPLQTLGMFEDNVYVDSLAPDENGLNIVFTFPKGEIYINGRQTEEEASVILKFQNYDYTRTLTVNQNSGRIDIE